MKYVVAVFACWALTASAEFSGTPLVITNISVDAVGVHLSWDEAHGASLGDLKLYESTNLSEGAWTEVTNPVAAMTLGGVIAQANANATFFRLFAEATAGGGIALDDPALTSTFAVVAFANASGDVIDWEGLTPPVGTVYALIMTKDAIYGNCTLQAKDYGGVGETPLGDNMSGYIHVYPGYDAGDPRADTFGQSMLAAQKLVDDWFDGTAGQVTQWCPQAIRDAAVKVSFPIGDANGYFVDGSWSLSDTGVSVPSLSEGTLKAFLLSLDELGNWERQMEYKVPSTACMLRSGMDANNQYVSTPTGSYGCNIR
ncbi:MAG: hypothetical protein FWF84_06155, partial [Kiritimatiellaeota bacterium]|nr:hypothetical protein [Kiritimatiellota bacterium]